MAVSLRIASPFATWKNFAHNIYVRCSRHLGMLLEWIQFSATQACYDRTTFTAAWRFAHKKLFLKGCKYFKTLDQTLISSRAKDSAAPQYQWVLTTVKEYSSNAHQSHRYSTSAEWETQIYDRHWAAEIHYVCRSILRLSYVYIIRRHRANITGWTERSRWLLKKATVKITLTLNALC